VIWPSPWASSVQRTGLPASNSRAAGVMAVRSTAVGRASTVRSSASATLVPLAVAVMVALPTASAVTRPSLSTVAMAISEEDQVTFCRAPAGPTTADSCSLGLVR